MSRLVAIAILAFPIVLLGQISRTSDEHAIQAVIDQFMEAWNRHDAKAFAAVFSEDADFTNWRGGGVSGRAKIEEFHAPVFATIFRKSQQEYTGIKTRFIRPDVAAVDVRWKMTGVLDRQGNLKPDREGLLSFVMAKKVKSWEIVVMHNLDISALPPAPQ